MGSHGFDRWSRNICPCANYRKDCDVAVSGELNKSNSYQNYTSIANESYLSKVESNLILLPNAIFLQLFGNFQIMKTFLPHQSCVSLIERVHLQMNETNHTVYWTVQVKMESMLILAVMNAFGKIAFITARIIALPGRACRWHTYTFVFAFHEKARRKRIERSSTFSGCKLFS